MRLELQTGNQRNTCGSCANASTNYATHECIGHKNDLTRSAKVSERREQKTGSAVLRYVTVTHVFEQKLCCGRAQGGIIIIE